MYVPLILVRIVESALKTASINITASAQIIFCHLTVQTRQRIHVFLIPVRTVPLVRCQKIKRVLLAAVKAVSNLLFVLVTVQKVILIGFLPFFHNNAKKTEPATALVTMEKSTR